MTGGGGRPSNRGAFLGIVVGVFAVLLLVALAVALFQSFTVS